MKLGCLKCCLCTLLILPYLCFSQSEFKEGYYVTMEGDTIHGLLGDKSGAGNFQSLSYKDKKSSQQQKFSPDQIRSYRFSDGRYFVSKEINIGDERRLVFIEYLVDGIADLYFYRDPVNYLYIIEKESGEIIEVQKEETAQKMMTETSFDPYEEIRILKVAFADCMEIQPQIEQADLTHKSLIDLTRNYHNYVCDEYNCIIYQKKTSPPMVYIAPIAGVSLSNLSFDEEFYSRFTYEPNQTFIYGVQIDAILAFINKRLALQANLIYGQNNYFGNYNDYYDLYINNNRLQASLLIKYSIPIGAIRPSIGIGMHNDFIRNVQLRAIVDNVPGTPPNETELGTIYMSNNLFGGVVQAGLNFSGFQNRQIFTNFRYTFSSGVSAGPSTRVTTELNSFSIIFGFYINKVR